MARPRIHKKVGFKGRETKHKAAFNYKALILQRIAPNNHFTTAQAGGEKSIEYYRFKSVPF
jgi:hypothetical protein